MCQIELCRTLIKKMGNLKIDYVVWFCFIFSAEGLVWF